MSKATSSGPNIDQRQKRTKPVRRQLVIYKLLAMAASPEGIPLGSSGSLMLFELLWLQFSRLTLRSRWQGFAPFGSCSFLHCAA